ncbi:hypothetical protein ACIQI8_41530 [Streptomyces sp. NPDC092369]
MDGHSRDGLQEYLYEPMAALHLTVTTAGVPPDLLWTLQPVA